MSWFYTSTTLIKHETDDSGVSLDKWISSKLTEQEIAQVRELHRKLDIGEYEEMFQELLIAERADRALRFALSQVRAKLHAPHVASTIAEMRTRVFDARKLVSQLGTEKDLEEFDSVVSGVISMEPDDLYDRESES